MNRTILITGATGNLGAAVLKKFQENDFQIAALISERQRSKIEDTNRVKTFPLDLLEESQVQQVVRQVVEIFGKIDMALLTVGGFDMGGLAETGEKELDKMYRLNFLTAYHTARQLFMQMQKQEDGGQVIFTGSRPGIEPALARNMLPYAFSKSLVFRLAELINEEGKDAGITASVIVPGIIDTPKNRESMPGADFSSWVSASEIADNVYHLSTPAGRQLRESIIKIYGGSQD